MVEVRRGAHPMAWMTWAVMLVAQLFFLGVAANRMPPAGAQIGVSPGTVTLFGVIAGVAAAASIVIRYTALLRPAHRGELQLQTLSGEKRFFNVSVVNWVLSETASLLGMMLAMRACPASTVIPFFAAGIALTLYHAPRINPLRPRVDRRAVVRERRRSSGGRRH